MKNSFAFDYLLQETSYFYVVCDANPLIEGHLLIIPKRHVSCLGEYTPEELSEFKDVYHQMCSWLKKEYGPMATFEHGKIGQTVFHSHIHLLPFNGGIHEIVPEGKRYLTSIKQIDDLILIFKKQGQYLFLSVHEKMFSVDVTLGCLRFFRDRFAKILGRQERGDWKNMRNNAQRLSMGHDDNNRCRSRFFNDKH
jgi:diadenosine tetraphosphate (Ap4A) HIT family hydrolase